MESRSSANQSTSAASCSSERGKGGKNSIRTRASGNDATDDSGTGPTEKSILAEGYGRVPRIGTEIYGLTENDAELNTGRHDSRTFPGIQRAGRGLVLLRGNWDRLRADVRRIGRVPFNGTDRRREYGMERTPNGLFMRY